MNCREIEEWTPLYLSGEMEGDQRTLFRAHLAQCRSCAAEIDQQIALDSQLRQAVSAELPDATPINRAVRGRIFRERTWRFVAVAAAVLFAAGLGYRVLRTEPVDRLYSDAALDHRLEVMEHQTRHWKSDPAEVEKLTARYELPNVAGLAPEGYRLEHAKMCGIDGKPALHLVYSNGSREFSLYVRTRPERDNALREVSVGSERLVKVQTDRLEAVIATDGSGAECLQFAQFAARVL